jgi:hypothetical protein
MTAESKAVRAGWTRTRLAVAPDMTVLDVGSGAHPNPRADVLCERDLTDDRHRGGVAVRVDRPLVRGDALQLPIRDQSIDFVIASHIAEHVDDPVSFCRELQRVAKAGYIETPSPLFEWLFDIEYHSWKVSARGQTITFTPKSPRPDWVVAVTEPIYKLYFAGQPSPTRSTYGLPAGRLGIIARAGLRLVRGVINRIGILHTRVKFSPGHPIECQASEFIDRRPARPAHFASS